MEKKTIFAVCFAAFTIILFFILHKKGKSTSNTTCSCSSSCPSGICPPGSACQNGVCQDSTCECSSTCPTGTCPNGQSCQNGICQAIPPPSCSCSPSCPQGTCPNGQSCQNGICRCNQAKMYGKNCDVKIGTLQWSDSGGTTYLTHDPSLSPDMNVNFAETSSPTKWYFHTDRLDSFRKFDDPNYPNIGIGQVNPWHGGSQNDFAFRTVCLGNVDSQCTEIPSLYTSTGALPDSDNIWKSRWTYDTNCDSRDSQGNDICYPSLNVYRDTWHSPYNIVYTQWVSPISTIPIPNNEYLDGTPVTWVDIPLSSAEIQRAMQL